MRHHMPMTSASAWQEPPIWGVFIGLARPGLKRRPTSVATRGRLTGVGSRASAGATPSTRALRPPSSAPTGCAGSSGRRRRRVSPPSGVSSSSRAQRRAPGRSSSTGVCGTQTAGVCRTRDCGLGTHSRPAAARQGEQRAGKSGGHPTGAVTAGTAGAWPRYVSFCEGVDGRETGALVGGGWDVNPPGARPRGAGAGQGRPGCPRPCRRRSRPPPGARRRPRR